jgi:hypothetical protein
MTQQRTLPGARTAAGSVGWITHLVGALVNAVLLAAVHLWPGWQVVPFLTAETPTVLGAVDAMLLTGIVVQLLLLVPGWGWLTAAGNLVTSVVGLLATVRVLQVFPFAFDGGFDWAPVVRVLLVLGVLGCAIGALVAVVGLIRLRRVSRD